MVKHKPLHLPGDKLTSVTGYKYEILDLVERYYKMKEPHIETIFFSIPYCRWLLAFNK